MSKVESLKKELCSLARRRLSGRGDRSGKTRERYTELVATVSKLEKRSPKYVRTEIRRIARAS